MSKKITPKLRKVAPVTAPDPRLQLARQLDRLADAELFLGHHHAAEHLSNRATQVREGMCA